MANDAPGATTEAPAAGAAPAADAPAAGADSQPRHVEGIASKAEQTQPGTAQKDGPATKGADAGQSQFDVQKSYDELRKQFTKVTQDYSRDRKTWNTTLSELQSMKKSNAELAALISKATERPVTPEQLMTDLQSQGLKALDPYFDKKLQAVTGTLQNAYVEQANKALLLEAQLEKLHRRLDTENYPDFQQLEGVMQEIADAEDCPIDWNQPTPVIYDALYKLAVSRNSETAVKAAEEFGRKQAERTAGKEAAAAVPAGGKAGTPIDTSKMSLAQLREVMVSQLGEAE